MVSLIKAVVELIQAAVLLFNPVGLINDTITGIFMAIKVVVVNGISFLTKSGRKGYDACKNAGEGLFGFRRKRDKMGKKFPHAYKIKKKMYSNGSCI